MLVALLVGFAKGANDESAKLVEASRNVTLLSKGCTGKDDATNPKCTQPKIDQANEAVADEQKRVGDLARLNNLQAVAGWLVLLGFLLGIAGILTNPVPGPDARHQEETARGQRRRGSSPSTGSVARRSGSWPRSGLNPWRWSSSSSSASRCSCSPMAP